MKLRTSHLALLVVAACQLVASAASDDTRVVVAARKGDATAVRALVQKRADINATEGDGSTALLWAAYHGDLESTRALLAAGADANRANRFGVTPLLQASRIGNVPVVEALIKSGADPNRAHPSGETPLMAAAGAGSVDAVRLFIARGANVNATETSQNQTSLMWAAIEGHVPVMDALLAAGADPNLAGKMANLSRVPLGDQGRMWVDHPSGGLTALMFAARQGHLEAARLLVDRGANASYANPDGLTPLLLAVINDRRDLAAMLLDKGANPNDGSLYEAVQLHNLRFNDTITEATRPRRVNANTISVVDLIGRMLDHGADPLRPAGHTMHLAGSIGGGAGGVNAITESAFARALRAQDVDVLRAILQKGVNPNSAVGGTLPLISLMGGGGGRGFGGGLGVQQGQFRFAGERSPQQAVLALIEAGADVNTANPTGDTALHVAAQTGNVAMIQLLADHGAKFDVTNAAGLTPLDLAMGKGRPAAPAGRAGGPPPGGRGGPPAGPQPQAIALLRQLMGLPALAAEPSPAEAPPAPPQGN